MNRNSGSNHCPHCLDSPTLSKIRPHCVRSAGWPAERPANGHFASLALVGSPDGRLLATLLVSALLLGWLLTRLRRSRKARVIAETRYHKLANQLTEVILLVDRQSLLVVETNQAALTTTGYSESDICGRPLPDVFPDLVGEKLREDSTKRRIHFSHLRRRDGSEQDTEVSVTEFQDNHRQLLCLVAHDVSHRRAAEEQVRANQRKLLHMAQHDPLTGLPNRLFLHSRFPQVTREVQESQSGIALIYVDLDHFKNINDSLGHGHGDRLLQIVAQRLRSTVSSEDAVIRMGGDEFVIIATLVPKPTSIDLLAQRVQAAVSAPIIIDDSPLSITASMGLAVYPRDGVELEPLLKHADIALYQAKEAGRGCHRYFDAHMNVRVNEDLTLEQALRHALGNKQFYIEFQPVVNLRNNRLASVEALLRWQHPELGQIPPSRFVPVVERTGLITQIGQFALENVLQQMRIWLDMGVACVPVAVNVAPQQLVNRNFVELVKRLTTQVGIDPQWLRFEITEGALLQNVPQLVGTLRQLREIGSEILIDDFGTGYSGLSYLTTLPVNTVKIDRSFVANMMNNARDEAVITSIIDMATRLNLVTIAEGIETREQALRLRLLGCHFAQGYFFSRPLSASSFRRLLQRVQ